MHDGEPLRMAGLPRVGGMVYFSVGRSGAFQRCEISWPAKADSTGCPERGPAWTPAPQAQPLHLPPAGTASAYLACH